MTLTKERIAESIQEEQYMTRGRAISVLETTLEIIKDTLARGEDVLISGFGKFNVRGKIKGEAGIRPQESSLPSAQGESSPSVHLQG